MSLTKSNARNKTLQFMDAVGSTRWDTTANSEVDQAISVAQDQEWRGILDANPYYAAEEVSVTTDASGRFARASLSTGSGNSAHRLYKVIGLRVGNVPVKIAPHAIDYLNAGVSGAQPNLAYRFGDYYQLLPATAGQAGLFTINYLPVRQDAIALDADPFLFPDGFEDVPLLMAAAYLLATKNGAEAESAVPLVGAAKNRRDDMMLALARDTVAPMEMRYGDNASDWGV